MTLFATRRGALTFYGVGVALLLLIGFTMSIGVGILMLITTLFSMSFNTWTMRQDPKRKPAAKNSGAKKARSSRAKS